jgi:hypothetical protein|nr:MAG TPA: hypothetical protein [Caudoviricetes sp.]
MNIPNKLPLVNQLELKYAGPAISETLVDSINDLLSLTYNYEHKLVWVKDDESFYFLNSGDGTNINNWLKFQSNLKLDQWNVSKTYKTGYLVYYNGILYQAKQDISAGLKPSEHTDIWQIITGQQNYGMQIFDNVDTVNITIDDRIPITNNLPEFTVYVGKLFKVGGNYEMNNDGTVKLEDFEIIQPDIERISNTQYTIKFYENGNLKKLSGYVIFE